MSGAPPPKPVDPLAIWREWVSEFETRANSTLNSAMGSEEFAQFMGKATGLSLGLQKTVADIMNRYLKTMNLPSRTDIEALGERLQTIEESLARISAALEQSGSNSFGAGIDTPRPAKMRKPPASGEQK